MFQNLFAALVPAAALFLEPPLLPASSAPASVGVRVERDCVAAENFSDAPRWVVFSSGGFRTLRVLAPHSSEVWACTEECLWDVELQVADTDGGALHLSQSVSLQSALELRGQTLWFGESPACWVESDGTLQPFFDGSAGGDAPPNPFHVPVIRPSDRPEGDRPPPIEKKPLPPI
jgi:hypothetical protein